MNPPGPVIRAVDAGHVNHGTGRVGCRQPWPCSTIRAARRAQSSYAAELARTKAIEAGRLSNAAARAGSR